MRYLFFSVIAIAIAIVGAERPFVDVSDDDNKRKLHREPSDFLFPDDTMFWDRILSDDMSTSMSMPMPISTPSEPTPSESAPSKSPASEPSPSDPTPSESIPSDPTPSEPILSETATPSEPTPSETAAPSEPTPS